MPTLRSSKAIEALRGPTTLLDTGFGTTRGISENGVTEQDPEGFLRMLAYGGYFGRRAAHLACVREFIRPARWQTEGRVTHSASGADSGW